MLQGIKQKMPVMEAQYKMITKTAQLVTKEIPQEEVNEMFATMKGIKEQLGRVLKYIFCNAIC